MIGSAAVPEESGRFFIGRSKFGLSRSAAGATVIGAILGVLLLFASQPLAAQIGAETEALPPVSASPAPKLKVLILGDSMSLCGFGKRLDTLFRRDEEVSAVYTYMACATIPATWLTRGSYTNAKTYCGYWSIATVPGKSKPSEFVDGYERGHVPKAYRVPKLERLLSTIQPDILVLQTGTNLFGIFRDGKTVRSDVQGPILRRLVEPFFATATTLPSPLKRIYLVGPPISGRVSREVQQFLFDELGTLTLNRAVLIDSRGMVPYPYRTMARDHEHFFGKQMDEWADAVFASIKGDMDAVHVASLPKWSQLSGESLSQATPTNDHDLKGTLTVKAQLAFKSKPLQVDQLLPYQESLVAFVYNVQKVVTGSYSGTEILVLHPAHIGLKPQPLGKYVIGKTFLLRLDPVDITPWNTVKTNDETGRLDLVPYIRKEDEGRLPSRGG
jgi:hypothetical protein